MCSWRPSGVVHARTLPCLGRIVWRSSVPATPVVQGFEGFLSSKDNLRKRSKTYKPEDRLFSLSSRTSPVVRIHSLFCFRSHAVGTEHCSAWVAGGRAQRVGLTSAAFAGAGG